MKVLIIKLNATGDVVRTTPLLGRLGTDITWITAAGNVVLLDGLPGIGRCLSWDDRHRALEDRFDLLLNLEDDEDVARFALEVEHDRLFGARIDARGQMVYTDSARGWFDLGLISRHGRAQADRLKLVNRRSYQDLLFEGLGLQFNGQAYRLPPAQPTGLSGDVAIAPVAGPVWPNKGWLHYEALKARLEAEGLVVNVLPQRPSLLQHIGDIAGHRCLVSGDSLPMHLALGLGVRCVTLFNCTSPWEIHGYGLQTQLVSPLLEEFFYKRHMDPRATGAIALETVFEAVLASLRAGQRAAASSVLRQPLQRLDRQWTKQR
jgi:heptosyltransferase II